MKKQVKLFSLLTLFTVVVNLFAVLVLVKPASALTGAKDTLDSLKAGVTGVKHTITFTAGDGDKVISFPHTGFTLTEVATATCTATDGATDNVVTCTNAALTSLVVLATNPVAGSYTITVSDTDGTVLVNVPIVDSDTVWVNGYITSQLYFDLDTNTDNGDCAATGVGGCHIHSGSTANPTNYTVDLGELQLLRVNKSMDNVMHSDGAMGDINRIYFDLSSNSAGGSVLTYLSKYGELRGPGHNIDNDLDLDIPSVANAGTITATNKAYGIQFASVPEYRSIGGVTIPTENAACSFAAGTYCAMNTAATTLYTTAGSIEAGRGALNVAAAIDGTNVPGTYQDWITFIATATY